MFETETKFSSGPDGFPSIFFKHMAVYIAQPLSVIFNLIMQNGALPDIWKTALVTPIFKKGLASEPGNYKPISITCIACRIFERIVKEYLIEHLTRNRVFNPAQHGFLARHSTCTNYLYQWLIGRQIWTIRLGRL